ncbi:MAG: response regulator [Fibromonadaceae bacterium]|jgi:putative two-component system response regulator|nr:response regulator [Fibromonadaceae bacterium]
MKTIFVVDDSDTCLSKVEEVLESQYRVMTLPSAAKMFAMLEKITPDLILLDISMPEMDGYTALRILKDNPKTANIPVIFLTGQADVMVEAHSFDLGVIDFIVKPFSALVLLNRVKMHMDMDGVVRERTEHLEQKTKQMESLYDNIISILADVVESRDHLTGGHIERTTIQTKILIDAMLERNVYADEIKSWNSDLVASSARLHDIGKIAVPDSILNKPDKLNEEEYEIMKKHVNAGEQIIDKIISKTREESFWNKAKIFASYHHERWDGTGYPRGLKGLDIPLQGRILAVVDVYDALISERVYKKAFDHYKAVEIIKSESGKQFDPKIVEVFCDVHERFMNVSVEW